MFFVQKGTMCASYEEFQGVLVHLFYEKGATNLHDFFCFGGKLTLPSHGVGISWIFSLWNTCSSCF